MNRPKTRSHEYEPSNLLINHESVLRRTDAIIDKYLLPQATFLRQNVINALHTASGKVDLKRLALLNPSWPRFLFPLVFAPYPGGHSNDSCKLISLHGCMELLENEGVGYKMGYAAQVLSYLSADDLFAVLKSLPGSAERMWLRGSLQVYDRILHLYGVMEDEWARNICRGILENKEAWEPLRDLDWSRNREILETYEFREPDIGIYKDDMVEILPWWTPRRLSASSHQDMPRGFEAGILDAAHNHELLRREQLIKLVYEECAADSAKDWNEAITSLMNGRIPSYRPDSWMPWPRVLFPIIQGRASLGRTYRGVDVNSFAECIDLLRDPVYGFRLGYAVQTLHDMKPEEIKEIRRSIKDVADREWVVGWMRLFDRVLNLHGVENNKEARKLCKETLSLLQYWEKPEVVWDHKECIIETKGEKKFYLGERLKEREDLLPEWLMIRSCKAGSVRG
ncbi:hypothetical protein B0T20DRAFT_409959 [Sordaria brevicollis]|uniref:Uncharacterized protein n=1 Tax=Sordaria brevicollis TaxID=83679 RepID=A0AAE0PGE5_SORBR|nr:hypothetical protein B0T20DRAFT_409959 [Sordaria brevicollis]